MVGLVGVGRLGAASRIVAAAPADRRIPAAALRRRSLYDRRRVTPRPTLLLVPSRAPDPAALRELPRRLASTGRALAGVYPFRILSLARTLAEPALLGRGLGSWGAGHDALLAARLLEGPHGLRLDPALPRGPVARALARTLRELRMAGVAPGTLDAVASAAGTPEDAARLEAVARLYRGFTERLEGRFADAATLLHVAADQIGAAPWLAGAEALLVEDGELEPLEEAFLESLTRHLPLRRIARPLPPRLETSSFGARAKARGIESVPPGKTLLAPLVPAEVPAGLGRLRTALFEPPRGGPVRDGSVELVTAPGEAAEVRSVARRLLGEAARGVPFEEMGVVLPRPDPYAPLLADLLERLGLPFRLHPSLPLRFGRTARSLLLLFRCRGLARAAVMEFLTFARVPYQALLGPEARPSPARWDALTREAGIVGGYERWILGLRHVAETETGAAQREEGSRREARLARAAEAESLLRVVELLSATLDGLDGEAPWREWSERLGGVLEDWVVPTDRGEEQRRVREVLADLAGLGELSSHATAVRWSEVEAVLESRFEHERLPLEPSPSGAVHVGALDAMAGLGFRFVAIPGLVEGGYPAVLHPDPFLLDAERRALGSLLASAGAEARPAPRRAGDRRQLSLFEDDADGSASSRDPASPAGVPTTQDRLLEMRRLFHRAVSQATERLVLSYPRADPRSGRERLPSLFFVAAASALEGRTVGTTQLAELVEEDELATLALEATIDRGERDLVRLSRDGARAEAEVAAGSPFFRQSRLATRARWHHRLTAYDGFVAPLPDEIGRRLDPVTADWPQSASRLATFSNCGFQYLLRHVLRLEPALEPEERRRLEPLERGSLFHDVAERFLRERRERGELPVRDSPELRERLLELGDESLAGLVAGSPPLFTVLWERERHRFRETLLAWLTREAAQAERATPAYFEVSFGLPRPAETAEPHTEEPVVIDLADGRRLRVAGKIDRIDRRPDGGLVLRDYKTGRAPRDDGSLFRGGKQLQIPFYVLAAGIILPEAPVVEAFLDYVDGGRRVSVDPAVVRSERFGQLLRGIADAIAQGVFLQEPAACEWCDFTEVCGPRGLLERRRRYKIGDRLLQRVLQLRDLG